MDQNSPPIDPAELKIEISKLDPPDVRIDCEIPARLVKRIHKKLKKGGLHYDSTQMIGLLSKICIDEGMNRLDEETIWGPGPLADAAPPTFDITKPFRLSAIVDVIPTIDLPDFSSFEIDRALVDVSEVNIETEMFEQRLEAGTPQPFDGELKYGDEITCEFKLTISGKKKPLFEQADCLIRIPAPKMPAIVHGMVINDLVDILPGHRKGDTIDLNIKIPESFPMSFQRGRDATLSITINETSRISPASIEEVITQYGTPNEKILRTQIQLSLKTRAERSSQQTMSVQVFSQLDKTIDIQLPERIVEQQLQKRIESTITLLRESGLPEEEITEELSDRSDHIHQEVRKSLKSSAILTILQKKLDIRIGEEELQEQIRILAESRQQRPEEVRDEAVKANQMGVFYGLCLERKVSQVILKTVHFNDIVPSDT